MAKSKKSNKITLSERRKEQIRRNFDEYFEGTKSVRAGQETTYLKKIRAGKERAKTAITDEKGKFIKIPQDFINKIIAPAIKNQNEKDGTNKTYKEYLQEAGNKEAIRDLFLKDTFAWSYNPITFEKALNNFKGDKIKVNTGTDKDGNDKIKIMTPEQLEKYIKIQQKQILKLGGYTFYFDTIFSKGFTEAVVNLPDARNFDNLEELEAEEFEGYRIIVSEKKKK